MAQKGTHRDDIVSGLWKFPSGVTREDIVDLANQLATGPDGERYLRLYVRPLGNESWALGFEYQFEGRTHKRYFHKTASQLMERFGENVAWDMGSGTTFVRAAELLGTPPPFEPGTQVRTTSANPKVTGWNAEALATRKWDACGMILRHHDSHGLCYSVRHNDGTIGYYDPSELEVLP